MKTKTPYYKIDQTLPPRHWYQRRVGWFGKTFLGIVTVSMLAAGSYGYVMNRATVKNLSAQASTPEKLHKVTSQITSDAENIIDVQYILDKWMKENPGETWSVTARSIDGSKFEASLNQDKTYESLGAKYLLMSVALSEQIPAEQYKNIKLDSGKTMASCVNLMIRLANPVCGGLVSEYLDYGKAQNSLREIGLSKTALESGGARTTSQDMATLLEAVNGGALQKNARDILLKSLREQHLRTGIPSGCPGCTVANEASQSGTVHDVAIVQYRGGSYVLTIFTKDGTLAQVGELAGKIQQKIIDTTAN